MRAIKREAECKLTAVEINFIYAKFIFRKLNTFTN